MSLAAIAAVALAAWVVLLVGAPTADSAAAFLVGWVVMMVAMMLPAAAPMILRYRLSQGARTIVFVAGYLLV